MVELVQRLLFLPDPAVMTQQIRKHGAYDHMPSGGDAIPWSGNPPTQQLGVHMSGTVADRPAASRGSEAGLGDIFTGTTFTAGGANWSSAITGSTIVLTDMSVTPAVEHTFTVTFVNSVTLTLSAAWTGGITVNVPYVIVGVTPSNEGLMYFATDAQESSAGTLYRSDGANWVPIGSNALSPSRLAYIYLVSSAYEIPVTVGGLGVGGTDWVPVPFNFPSGITTDGFGTTNAWNHDPDTASMLTDGDLSDFHIYSSHYPLTDWGWSSGDQISSVRIYGGWNGWAGSSFRTRVRIAVYDPAFTSTAAAEQTLGMMLSGFGTVFAGEQWGGQAGNELWSGRSLTAAPTSPTDLIVPNFQPAEITMWSDPGSVEWNAGESVSMDHTYLFDISGTSEGGDENADLILFAFNPGPKTQHVDVSIMVELLNQYNQFPE